MSNKNLRNNLELNVLLARLPPEECDFFTEKLELVQLPVGVVIHQQELEIEKVYFPLNGVISVLMETANGEQVETALVGSDGVAGSFAGFGLRIAYSMAVVQAECTALALSPDRFEEAIKHCTALRERVSRYHAYLFVQAQQTGVCNLLHPVEARLCRWILQFRDRVGSNSFALTQDFIARMLGVTRPTLNLALSQLKTAGFIRTGRGAFEILDSEGIHESACECYDLLTSRRMEILPGDKLIAPPRRTPEIR